MKATRLALALAALAFTATTHAATVGLDLVSYHFPAESYLTNVNPGVYVRFENGVSAGAYRNSFGRVSAWAGYTFEHGPFALTAGVISGYQIKRSDRACTADETATNGWTHCWNDYGNTKGPVGPLLAPSVALPSVFGITPRLTVLPKFTAKGHTVAHLSIERAF